MRIAMMVEGKSERALIPKLREFISRHLHKMPNCKGQMPKLDPVPFNGRIPKGGELRKQVDALLSGKSPADHVIALTDVYTGTKDFATADDAKKKMRDWVGKNDRFHPHAALHDFEAWLIPFWDTIVQQAKGNKQKPTTPPESINHQKPPSKVINEVFLTGERKTRYIKTVDGPKILKKHGLEEAASECPELKALLNTILKLGGASQTDLL